MKKSESAREEVRREKSEEKNGSPVAGQVSSAIGQGSQKGSGDREICTDFGLLGAIKDYEI